MADLLLSAPWSQAIAALAADPPRRVAVVGAADRGKSSFCRLLIEALLAAGREVAFLDSDLGQKDVGPPTTVTLALPRAGQPLAAAEVVRLAFVGTISPLEQQPALIAAAVRLADTSPAATTVIDTSGTVTGSGRTLKLHKLTLLAPDRVIAIGEPGELDPLLRSLTHLPLVPLPPASAARAKGAGERARLRAEAFRSYFAAAQPAGLDLTRVPLRRSLLFSGRPVMLPGALHAEETAEGLVAVAGAESALPERVKRLEAGFERGLLCGLFDGQGETLGLGRVEEIDFASGRLRLFTPVPAGAVAAVELGDLRFTGGVCSCWGAACVVVSQPPPLQANPLAVPRAETLQALRG